MLEDKQPSDWDTYLAGRASSPLEAAHDAMEKAAEFGPLFDNCSVTMEQLGPLSIFWRLRRERRKKKNKKK